MLRGFDDDDVLTALADRFVQREFEAGEAIVQAGAPADQIVLIAHGKVKRQGRYAGRRPDWKKAYVKLREGEKLPEFLQGA